LDGAQNEFNLLGVSCTGIMSINLLGRSRLVERDKTMEEIIASHVVVVATLIVREVISKGRMREFLGEEIDLVQEQDDGGLDKPPGVANGIEKGESLLHTINALIFVEDLVVLGEGDEEHEGGDILKAMNPLLSF